MKTTKHLFEEQFYLLENRAVALNPLFTSEATRSFFLKKMEEYLSPVCRVLAYSLDDVSYRLLVQIKSRKDFVDFYQDKYGKSEAIIPESTYIFSQNMSNWQVCYVKFFNSKEGRTGGLMAGRFKRTLIESKEELLACKERLNAGIVEVSQSEKWFNVFRSGMKNWNSSWFYEESRVRELGGNSIFQVLEDLDLVELFKNTLKYNLRSSNSFHFNRIYRLFLKNNHR